MNRLLVFIEMKQNFLFLKKRIQNGRLKKTLIFQIRQFSIFFHENFLGN
jgi:hypothetical protein